MTPPPEERARALVPHLFGEDASQTEWRRLIASAIRDAENAALERAAAIADRENESEDRDLEADYFVAARIIADDIRALKHKEP